jgi:hypothetical protein
MQIIIKIESIIKVIELQEREENKMKPYNLSFSDIRKLEDGVEFEDSNTSGVYYWLKGTVMFKTPIEIQQIYRIDNLNGVKFRLYEPPQEVKVPEPLGFQRGTCSLSNAEIKLSEKIDEIIDCLTDIYARLNRLEGK